MRQSLDLPMNDVEAFHLLCDVPAPNVLGFPDDERIELRIRLIEEEVNKELIPSVRARDMVGTADGIADAIYVLCGMALEFGIPLEDVWEEVHKANMAKADPVTGVVKHREDGKVMKPDGWVPPDIEGILDRTRKRV